MKNSIAIGVSCFLFTAAACIGAEPKTISQSFDVSPGGQLSIEADQGDIEVSSWDKSTVSVVVERDVTGGSDSQKEKVLKSHKVQFSRDGNTVRVEAKMEKASKFSFRSRPNLNVHFRINVPRNFNANLDTAGGSIEVKDLHGNVDARTSGGDLNFDKIEGSVEGRTSGGNVKAVGCTDKLQAQTSGGNIVIKDYTGPSATGDTSGGNVDVHGCTGKLQVRTSGGDIKVDAFSGSGIYATTSGGAITFGLDKQPAEDCIFKTSGGNVTARVPAEVAMNLNASTGGGNISTAIPVATVVQGKTQEGKLEGKMNGGGPMLTLTTSGGDIQVLKR